MVDISPGAAFMLALNSAFNAAHANAPQGNLGAGIPGLAQAAAEQGGAPGQIASGATGGTVGGTATTGTNALNSLLGGGATAGDPLTQQIAGTSNFLNATREPGERGDLGAGVTGGDPRLLLAMLSGNPLAMLYQTAQAISGQQPTALGTDPVTGNATIAGVDLGRAPATRSQINEGSETFREERDRARERSFSSGGSSGTSVKAL